MNGLSGLPPGWALIGYRYEGKPHIIALPRTRLIDIGVTARRNEETEIEFTVRPHGISHKIIIADDMRTALNQAFRLLQTPGGLFLPR